MASTINVLLSSFAGLGLPPTLSIPLCSDLPITSLASILSDRLPEHADELVLTSSDSSRINPTSTSTLSSLIKDGPSDLLPLRLTTLLLGGKGGFGSQLRAAGGRMSSRKNRNNNRDPNASSRNLDGRRLRTVTEAKALAEYLATKPDMDKKEREEKRQRWEAIVESAEKREEEIKNGKKGVRLDGDWVEKKEEEEGKTREAVLAMMRAELEHGGPDGSESDEGEEGSEEMEVEGEVSGSGSGSNGEAEEADTRSFYGWDEEDMSEDDEVDEEVAQQQEPVPTYEGKGKARA
ncbi:hypothetical protein B9Z65_8009 [Elsinoe australis]|uniref:Uncharacterized protein n=1 Tax=Elsinoe australis TaxID=40998 RepID=A0A2P7YVT5_9PEZI|nr:hypothetical protein B9Z65_8009 [Elsinoe australis]